MGASLPLIGLAVLVGGALLVGGVVAIVLFATLPKREDR